MNHKMWHALKYMIGFAWIPKRQPVNFICQSAFFQSTFEFLPIVLLDKGVIVEKGAHDVLIENNGLYSTMYHMQADYYNID